MLRTRENLLFWLFLATFVIAFGLPFIASGVLTKDLPDPDLIIPNTGGKTPTPTRSTATVLTREAFAAMFFTATNSATATITSAITEITETFSPTVTRTPTFTRTPVVIEPTFTKRPKKDPTAQPLPTIAPTDPPATEPPATEPPATEPPATEPPVTEPPVTEPPATEPSATEPPLVP